MILDFLATRVIYPPTFSCVRFGIPNGTTYGKEGDGRTVRIIYRIVYHTNVSIFVTKVSIDLRAEDL